MVYLVQRGHSQILTTPYHSGARPGFRTDTAISNNRAGGERTLQRWVPDVSTDLDGSLESGATTSRKWDQFAENERLFGLKTDYNENFYTTAIDRSHPQYSERVARADRAAREIEKSAPTTAHVAEERVMDFAGGDDQGADEEDKYSGVRRQQDFPPLASTRDNKYTPPARRAPTGHTTVVGAPVDPAIISSQIKGGPRKPANVKAGDAKPQSSPVASRPPPAVATPQSKTPEPKATEKLAEPKQADPRPSATPKETTEVPKNASAPPVSKSASKPTTPALSGSSSLRAATGPSSASLSPGAKTTPSTVSSAANSPAPPSVTDNVENALLKDFRDFATSERHRAEKARQEKVKADSKAKIQELKNFADNFKLPTPVPKDLIPIMAKDPAKQRQIQERALQNAEQLAKSKADAAKPKGSGSSASTVKSPTSSSTPGAQTPTPKSANTPAASTPAAAPPAASAASAAADNAKLLQNSRPPQGPVHPPHGPPPSGMQNRHPNARGPYIQQNYRQQSQPYRDRPGPQHAPQGHNHNAVPLAERIRSSEHNQNRYNKNQPNHGPPHFVQSGDVRVPPTGPANTMDARRLSAIPPGPHMAQKLNPATHEFRPSPSAPSFNPAGLSTSSSPRSAVNHMSGDPSLSSATTAVPTIPSPRAVASVLIRRKTQAVSAEKCDILTYIKTIKPPQGRNWDENDQLRPSFDTPLLWRQIQNDVPESPESTMHLKYTEYFERMAFAAASMATPIPGHAMPHGMPQMAHQHQLPLHMQQPGGPMGPRLTQHMPPMPMHNGAGGPHGHIPQVSFNGSDDHRMMASNSAQSYASPRMAQVPMYPQQVGTTPQMAYNQPVMPFIPNGPQFRGYSNNPQFMPPQPGMMPMMAPGPYVAMAGGMMAQQMPVYPGGPQFMGPPGAGGAGAGGVPPPQPIAGSNGYPSPGRPVAAPMMGHQGSQQGQPMYGMSPSMQYQQPAFGPQHPGQGGKLFFYSAFFFFFCFRLICFLGQSANCGLCTNVIAKVPMRGGFSNPGSQQYSTSPQNMYQYGPPHRNGSGNYSGKNYQGHGHNSHQGPPHQQGHSGQPPNHQNRPAGGESEEAK